MKREALKKELERLKKAQWKEYTTRGNTQKSQELFEKCEEIEKQLNMEVDTMTDKDINILIADRCTESEAKAALKRGTQIYSKPQEWIDSLKESNCYDGQTIEEARKGKYTDISMIEYDNHEYLIEYVN